MGCSRVIVEDACGTPAAGRAVILEFARLWCGVLPARLRPGRLVVGCMTVRQMDLWVRTGGAFHAGSS